MIITKKYNEYDYHYSRNDLLQDDDKSSCYYLLIVFSSRYRDAFIDLKIRSF